MKNLIKSGIRTLLHRPVTYHQSDHISGEFFYSFVVAGVVKTASPVKIRRNHWTGDASLIGAGVGSNPTRNQIFLITFNLA